MENSKDYFVARIVANEAMQHNRYMDFICHDMKEQISNKILDIVSDGNEYAIKLLPEQRIKNSNMLLSVEIRQGISVKELVRCKDCKYWNECGFGMRDDQCHCSYIDCWVNADFFCAKGERRTE